MSAENFSEWCPECQCCDRERVECWDCGGLGESEPGHLYELDPFWYEPDDTETCDTCQGEGSWWVCGCIGGLHFPLPAPEPSAVAAWEAEGGAA